MKLNYKHANEIMDLVAGWFDPEEIDILPEDKKEFVQNVLVGLELNE